VSYNVRTFSVMPPEFERDDLPLIFIDELQRVFLPHKDVAPIDIDCWLERLMSMISRRALPSVCTLSAPRLQCKCVRLGLHSSWCRHRPRRT